MATNFNNVIYWIHNHLDNETILTLKRIARDGQDFYSNRMEIAHLIALDCVIVNLAKETITLTSKGKDALSFFMAGI